MYFWDSGAKVEFLTQFNVIKQEKTMIEYDCYG